MGRAKIAEKSEIAHFRIDGEVKEFLEDYAKHHGVGFSELARNAMADYAETLKEDLEIEELKKIEKYKKTISILNKVKKLISENKELNTDEAIDLMIKLNSFVEEHQKRFSQGIPLKRIWPEVLKYIFALNVGVARQYLAFHRKMAAWSKRMEATREYIETYTPEFSEKVLSIPEENKRKEE